MRAGKEADGRTARPAVLQGPKQSGELAANLEGTRAPRRSDIHLADGRPEL
jgi:hypothetical protein